MAMTLSFGRTRPDIPSARDRYRKNFAKMERERAAFESARRIAAGETEQANLNAIIDWKSTRPKHRIMSGNTPAEISEALRAAVSTKQV
jgi:CelD/BcsL family acetyltransferase involved in cellulose biosynthesis